MSKPEEIKFGDTIEMSAFGMLACLREGGWDVAVHNDFHQHGKHLTFWLFTHPCGLWAKGEGESDAVALRNAVAQASERLSHPRFNNEAQKIVMWLDAMADKLVRDHGQRGEHGVEIIKAITDAIRRGDWRDS